MKLAGLLFSFVLLSAGALSGQIATPRAVVEFDGTGVFPIGGFKAEQYSSGPGLRAGGEFRFAKHVAAEAGMAGAWMATNYACNRIGCSYSRLANRFLDYGLRGVLPLSGGRVELSLGVGGGYIWYDGQSGDSYYYNSSLFQYSGKAAIGLTRGGRWRVNLAVRAWRDLGRPIQQWLSTEAGISYGFGTVR